MDAGTNPFIVAPHLGSELECGVPDGIYWDKTTKTWRKRLSGKSVSVSCTEIEAELYRVSQELEKTRQDAAAEWFNHAAAQDALDKANERIAELEQEVEQRPDACKALEAHLHPVQRLNGEVVYYAVSDLDCKDTSAVLVTTLGGDKIHDGVE